MSSSETTAAIATTEAPNTKISEEIHTNAEHLQAAAEKAAQTAQSIGSDLTGEKTATSQLQTELKGTTNAAVSEGQANVQGYINQASNLATNAYNTAAQYVPESVTTKLSQAQAAAQPHVNAAYNAASNALGQAQAAAQPHVERATAAVQPHLQNAQATIQPHLDNAQAALKPHVDKAVELGQNLVGNAKAGATDVTDAAKTPTV